REKAPPLVAGGPARRILDGTADERRDAREREDLRISALGSGSDYTPFLQHLGIPSLNLGFGGEGETDRVYHSIYDSYDHYTRFADPGFYYAAALAKVGRQTILRFANAEHLPLAPLSFADTITEYLREVPKLSNSEGPAITEKTRRVSEKTYLAVPDPTAKLVPPNADPAAANLNFDPLKNALTKLQQSSRNYETALRD